jgi:hypothetical protein
MEKKNRICPYNAEYFMPKRDNQIFASRYNQIMFNNNKNRELQKPIKETNKKLLKNYRILYELLKEKKEKTFSADFLIGKGFSFHLLTNIFKEDNRTVYGIYNYAFYKLNNNEIKIIKL